MLTYPHNEIIRRILKDKADLVYKGGLNYLIPQWQEFVENSGDEDSSLEEWLIDLDCRGIIDDILEVLPANEKLMVLSDLQEIDNTFKGRTFKIIECVWGPAAERANGFRPEKNWYYYRVNRAIYLDEETHFTKSK